METARVANATDLDRLVELAREAIEELRPTKGGDVWARTAGRAEPVEDALRSALTDHDHLKMAAVAGNMCFFQCQCAHQHIFNLAIFHSIQFCIKRIIISLIS